MATRTIHFARAKATACRASAIVACLLIGDLGTRSVNAQTAQIPFTAPIEPAPQSGDGTFGTPASSFPPPAFDAYGSGTVSPSTAPYAPAPYGGVIPPPVAPPPIAGAQPTPLFSEGLPLGWETGTFGYQQSDGTTVQFRRFLERFSAEYTYLHGDRSADSFEVNRFELSSTFALPLASIETPLLITPGFAANWLEGPISAAPGPPGPSLPPRVYDAYLDLGWYPQPTPEFGAELGVRTGVWSDFKVVNSDSVRLLGRGLAVARVSPRLEFLAGVVYLDRVRVKLLPAGGFRYRPNDVWDIYLVFPNPKIRRRLQSSGTVDWAWYVAGEYGGGSWTLDRAGTSDRIDYNDIRIVLGLEWESQTMVQGHLEFGFVFDREIIYAQTPTPNFVPDNTFMLRAGVDF